MYQAIDLTDPNVIENLSDGNHTFAELYHHRHLLWLSMLRGNDTAWISKKHDDGSEYEGWFVSGLKLASGNISYHMPDEYWDMITKNVKFNNVRILKQAPPWDGHTSIDVLNRLRAWHTGTQGVTESETQSQID